MLLGADINLSGTVEQFGQQQMNLGGHFTWPVRDGQISPCIELIRYYSFNTLEREIRPPEKKKKNR